MFNSNCIWLAFPIAEGLTALGIIIFKWSNDALKSTNSTAIEEKHSAVH